MKIKSLSPTFEIGIRAYIAVLTICFTLIILSACSLAIYTIYQVTKSQSVNSSFQTSSIEYYNDVYNVSALIAPEVLKKRGIPDHIIEMKRKKCFDYVKRYTALAKQEENKYGIPASITLTQGLLESDAGESSLARKNNHFGIKCFSKKCEKGHCYNYTDDSHKDFFRIYKSVEESYRDHSLFLLKDRYKHLNELAIDDYRGWAIGLQKAGYATDKEYGEKLILILECLRQGPVYTASIA